MRKIFCCLLAASILLLCGAHAARPEAPPSLAPVERTLHTLTADAPGVWQYRLYRQADGDLLAADALRRADDGTWESFRTLWQPTGETWRMVHFAHRQGTAAP